MKLCLILCMCLLLGSEVICCDMNHQGSRKHCECSTNYVQSSLDHVTHVESRGAAVVSTTPNTRPQMQGSRQDGYPHSVGGYAVSPSGSEEALLKHTLRQQHDDSRRQQKDPLSLSDVMFMATRKSTSYLYHTPEGTQIDLQGQL